MKIKPLGDRIVVKMVEMETKTAGGILIPQTAQEKTQEGVVLAIGDDEAIKVKVDDKVIYDKYAGTTIKVGGEEQLILKRRLPLFMCGSGGCRCRRTRPPLPARRPRPSPAAGQAAAIRGRSRHSAS
jgi:chaperonin GroES